MITYLDFHDKYRPFKKAKKNISATTKHYSKIRKSSKQDIPSRMVILIQPENSLKVKFYNRHFAL